MPAAFAEPLFETIPRVSNLADDYKTAVIRINGHDPDALRMHWVPFPRVLTTVGA